MKSPAVSNTPLRLTDAFGRTATDLRVSLTDRCNLRCTYCMPAEGLKWMPTEDTLTDEEMLRLIGIGVGVLGIEEVRFTGGEPLLRRSLPQMISEVKQMRTQGGTSPEVSITTNGLGLDKKAQILAAAGLDRVNVSLDTVDPKGYAKLTRRDRFDDVLAGLEAVTRAGLGPIKVNTLVLRGVNDDGVADLLRFCLGNNYQLRFIEHMPLGPRHTWRREEIVTGQDLRESLEEEFDLTPSGIPRGAAPAQLWNVEPKDKQQPAGLVGFISSVTSPFCVSCDRTRLTADGQMRTCLFSNQEFDLRTPLRAGASDEELAALWVAGAAKKEEGHLIGTDGFVQPERSMSKIGG